MPTPSGYLVTSSIPRPAFATDASGSGSGYLSVAPTLVALSPLVALSATYNSGTSKIRVVFNRAVKQISSSASDDALNTANYAVVHNGTSVSVSAVTTVSTTTVDLTVAALGSGYYTVTPSNLVDLYSNVVT